jgi:cytochrome c oxidase subunit 4
VDLSAADALPDEFAQIALIGGGAMPRREISVRAYIIVCVVLVLLTGATVGFSLAHVAPIWHLVVGLTIGLCKATLVVLFFMHVLISDRLTWIVIVVVCFWLVILVTLTMTDYLTRGMAGPMPGH